MEELFFEVPTPLGMVVRCTRTYWDFIVTQKHPVLAGHAAAVRETLSDPDEVRRSRQDPAVMLFYRGAAPRWMCAVARVAERDGFLITAYPTDAVKAGEVIWTRSK